MEFPVNKKHIHPGEYAYPEETVFILTTPGQIGKEYRVGIVPKKPFLNGSGLLVQKTAEQCSSVSLSPLFAQYFTQMYETYESAERAALDIEASRRPDSTEELSAKTARKKLGRVGWHGGVKSIVLQEPFPACAKALQHT